MKKLLASLLSAVLVLSMCSCSEHKEEEKTPDVEDDGLVTVYLLTSQTSYNADGSIAGVRYEYIYDNNGNMLIEREYRNGSDTPEMEREYTYNENGQLHNNGQAQYQYNQNGTISSAKVYFVRANGSYDSDSEYVTYRYSYDENENLTCVEMIDRDDTIRKVASYEYDEKQRLVVEEYGALQEYYNEFTLYVNHYSYNAQGNLDKIEMFTGANYDGVNRPELKESVTVGYTYDTSGKLLSRSYYTDRYEVEEYTCEYDENGELIKVIDERYGTGQTGVYEYHYKGSRVDTIDMTFGSGENPLHCVFHYDENGNIVRRVYDDGSYIAFGYMKMELPSKDAQRCSNVQWLRYAQKANNLHYHGQLPRFYDLRNEYLSLVTYPDDILYPIDIWGR